jgi:DNA-binding MarR family transcriptional regulator
MMFVPRLEVLEAKAKRYPDMDPLTCEAYITLRQVGDLARSTMEHRLAAEGISHGRFMLLVVLDCFPNDPMPASELAERSGVTKQTVTSLLDGLEKDGYVARRPHQQDRRSIVVQLLPKGARLLAKIMPGMYRRQLEMMADLTRDEKRQLTRLLRKVQVCADQQNLVETQALLTR